ncbi:argininosuccinate lyase [Collinsella sp. zg1085]|uniref:argininosuccinate lyase n=1 Tax=Collinsella sp. zg1085 TaxID=2844380 RepID=UPI001C0B4A53|nr:argininosuccinate lyase [Collinsella sp. zg1085]QWT17219.1 argininosuccinate lyase [Collinsella sp. zg1085]
MALWGGRFEAGVAETTQAFGASLPVDRHLYHEDIQGSKAHATMLAQQGIISHDDADAIVAGLTSIEHDIDAGAFTFDINDEDIHMAVERELIARIGEAGKRVHTGRSRNDQVVTDTRLAAKRLAASLMQATHTLRTTLHTLAQQEKDTVLPGYTHLQHAQPVLLAHHLLAYAWMFKRDFTRFYEAYQAANMSSLGAAALAGTSYPLNRRMTAYELGFADVIPNSLDAVSDRDFLLDLQYAASVCAMHLSRLCEELVIWSTSEFGFVTFSDEFSTGSSIMPQKKNPDFAELIRGKTGRVYGNLMQLLVTMKGLPLAYNKDLQEDKAGMFDSAHTVQASLELMSDMLLTCTFHADAMWAACQSGYLAATDIADYLVKRGMPFREAHAVVGQLVLVCEQRGCDFAGLALEDFRRASECFEADIVGELDIARIVAARNTEGGTAPEAVAQQMKLVRATLVEEEAILGGLS